jgi:hypothetical protein
MKSDEDEDEAKSLIKSLLMSRQSEEDERIG